MYNPIHMAPNRPILVLDTLFDLHIYQLALLLLIPTCIAIAVFRSRSYGLEHIPGPFLGKYTAAMRVYLAVKNPGPRENLFMKAHAKYGDVIRISPRSVSVLDPEAVSLIYGVKARLDKSPSAQTVAVPNGPKGVNLLGTLEEGTHARYRRPIQHAYSLTALKKYEPYTNDTINQLAGILDRYASEMKPVNISLYLYYWSYDTVGKLTFGMTSGYMDHESDFNGFINLQQKFLAYINIVPQMPSLRYLFLKNPLLRLIPQKTPQFIEFTTPRVNKRLAEWDPSDQSRPDLLSHFIAAKSTNPDLVDDAQVLSYGFTNVLAGSLSSSHVVDEIMQWLVYHPSAQQRIRDEIKGPNGETDFPTPFDWARKSLYLEGVIYEGYRFHNIANVLLERKVSPAGMKLPTGQYLPPGTYVGVNPAAMNRRRDVFGDDADAFNPLRWMKGEAESEERFMERRARMDKSNLSFGFGSRSCVGKNIVQLELFKVLASLLTRYDFTGVGEFSRSETFKVQTNVRVRKQWQ